MNFMVWSIARKLGEVFPLRRVLPWLALLALVVALAWGAYSWAWQRGASSRDGEVTFVTAERDAALWSVGQLSAAAQQQSDMVEQAGRDTAAARNEGALAASDGRRADAAEVALREQLADAMAKLAPIGECKTPAAAQDAWRRM